MKKTIITLLIASVALFPAVAQETAQQPVKQYTPVKGDFGFGVDLIPVVRSIGGAFNGSEATPVGGKAFSDKDYYLSPDVSVMGKYLFSDKWAFRLNLGLKLRSDNNKFYTQDDLDAYLNGDYTDKKVVDSQRTTKSGGSMMAGMEYRLGKSRVQGLFGAGILFGYSTSKITNKYGNAMTELNQNPSNALNQGAERLLQTKNCSIFTYGAYASVGAEWFVAPKIAIGATVDLYVYGNSCNNGYRRTEKYDNNLGKIVEWTTLEDPGTSSVSFGTGNLGGSLYMSFYF